MQDVSDISGPDPSIHDGADQGSDNECCKMPEVPQPAAFSPAKAREERKKVLKLSVRKLRAIEDPETSLCRSVLINNTMKRIQVRRNPTQAVP